MSSASPEAPDQDVPELGDEFFESARPSAEIMPAEFLEAVRRRGGRPRKAEPKKLVSIRLEAKVLRHLREKGPGWQTAVNAALADLIERGQI